MARRERGRGWAVVVCVLLMSVMSGCRDQELSDGERDQGGVATTTGVGTGAAGVGPAPGDNTADSGAMNELDGRKARTLPNGAVIYPAPAATEPAAPASSRCAHSKLRTTSGRMVSVTVPPAPGLTARRSGSRDVEVVVVPGNPPRRCRPAFVNLLVDDNDDPHPPVARTVRLRGSQRIRLEIHLFKQMKDPDTARATAVMRRGRTSRTSSVAILR